MTFERVGSITLPSEDGYVSSGIIDTTNGFAYFGTGTGNVVKVRLSDFTRVGSINVSIYPLVCAVIDKDNGFAYFGTVDGQIVYKIRLSDFTSVGSITLSGGGSNPLTAAAIDTTNGFAYFCQYGFGSIDQSRVSKVRLSDFSDQGHILMDFVVSYLRSAVIDDVNGFLYVGNVGSTKMVTKIRLSDFTRITQVETQPNTTATGVIDITNGFAYFGSGGGSRNIIRLQLSDFTIQGVLELEPGEDTLVSSIIDTSRGYAYFACEQFPAVIVKINLSDFTRLESLTLDSAELYPSAFVFDSVNEMGYIGCGTSPGIIVKVNLSEVIPVPDIIATEISPGATYCTEPCDVDIDITWTNNGTGPGTFEPAILLDGNRTGTGENITLNPLESITRTFNIINLTKGTYEICADPNSLPCVTIEVVSPAQIVATSIIPDKIICTEPCDINVDITWTNEGDVSGGFVPTILVNGIPTSLPIDIIDAGQNKTKTFTVSDLSKGTYEICADPNSLPCVTITVEKLVAAGMSNVLMLGLLSGGLLLFFAKEKEKKEKIQ